MSVYTVGRNGFHKGEKTLEAAMDKTMEQDTINIKESENNIKIQNKLRISILSFRRM